MDNPIPWLEVEHEQAKRELEDARKHLEEAQQVMNAVQKRFDASLEMLQRAKSQLTTKESAPHVHIAASDEEPRASMPTLIEGMLRERGPLRTAEILPILKGLGREKTTPNSINTTMSRYKPKRFNKTADGKWFVVETA